MAGWSYAAARSASFRFCRHHRAASTRNERGDGRRSGSSRGGNDRCRRGLKNGAGPRPPPRQLITLRSMSLYAALGVRRVINACGIYSDLGGSCWRRGVGGGRRGERDLGVDGRVAGARRGADRRAVRGRGGARGAGRVGRDRARRGRLRGARDGRGRRGAAARRRVGGPDAARARPYKYARCATLAGARVESSTTLSAASRRRGRAPPRASGRARACRWRRVRARAGRRAGRGRRRVHVLPARRARGAGRARATSRVLGEVLRGAERGRLRRRAGRARRRRRGARLHGYESGPWRHFGRAWKLDRSTVAATVAALEAWLGWTTTRAWRGYAELAARARGARWRALPGARVELRQFTLDERLVETARSTRWSCRGGGDPTAVRSAGRGDPSVRAMFEGDAMSSAPKR